jgi:hypothetical protein
LFLSPRIHQTTDAPDGDENAVPSSLVISPDAAGSSLPPVSRNQLVNRLPLSLSLTAVRVTFERGKLKEGLQEVPKGDNWPRRQFFFPENFCLHLRDISSLGHTKRL